MAGGVAVEIHQDVDAVGLYPRRQVGVGHLRLRRHVAERPMVLPDSAPGGNDEGRVRMMPGVVDVVHQGRPLVGAGAVLAMAR